VVAVGDVYRLSVECLHVNGNVVMANVFHFRQKAGFTSAINLIGDWRLVMETEFKLLFSGGCRIQKYSARSIIPLNTDFYESTHSIPGTGGANALPPLVAAVMTWRTGLPGRRKRGRSYIGGVDVSRDSGGFWSTTQLNNMNAWGAKMMTVWGPGGTSATTEFGVWSRLNAGPVPPYAAAGFTPVTAYTAQVNAGSMGTRRRGRGS
jgi:hypothetical protein